MQYPIYADFPTHFPRLMRHALVGGGIDCGQGWRRLLFDLFARLEQCVTDGLELEQFPSADRPHLAPDDGGDFGRLAWLYQEQLWFVLPYAVQVKQKFGSLRVNVHGATEAMIALIEQAQRCAERTCEFCGEPGTVHTVGRFPAVRCLEHASSRLRT